MTDNNIWNVEKRFWDKVNKTDACWLWTAHTTNDGYGLSWNGSRLIGAHRLAYELLVGEIPKGLQIDHLCRNRSCVNPAHLEPVTHQENIRRGETGKNHRDKTHCPQGHEYAGDNLYIGSKGDRECKTCHRKHNREYARRKATQRLVYV